MRCMYREKRIYCGDYLEIDIYPVFRASGARKKRYKPTSDVQKRLNRHNAEQKIIRLLNTNYTADDIRFDLTYSPDNLPADDKEALRFLQLFLRRLKRHRIRRGMPELKYIAVTEKSKQGRYHHHLVINGGVSLRDLAEIWGLGYTQAKPLQFDEYGVTALGRYLVKEPVGSKFFSYSRNLKHPEVKITDGKISQRRANELAQLTDCPEEFEKHYPGYAYAGANPLFNDINNHTYLCVNMYIPKQKSKSKRKNN